MKTALLAEYLDRKFDEFDELGCPRIDNKQFKKHLSRNIHLSHYNSRSDCALKKPRSSMIFFPRNQLKIKTNWFRMVLGKVFRCLFTVVILCFYLLASHILRNIMQMVSKF